MRARARARVLSRARHTHTHATLSLPSSPTCRECARVRTTIARDLSSPRAETRGRHALVRAQHRPVLPLDVLLNFRTTYVDDVVHREVTDASRIARRYLSTWCAIDVFSSVPFDWFFPQLFAGLGGHAHVEAAWRARAQGVQAAPAHVEGQRVHRDLRGDAVHVRHGRLPHAAQAHVATTFVGHIMGCLWAAVARGSRTGWQFGYFDGDDDGDGDGYERRRRRPVAP